jgi:hypothetical protein
MLRRRPLLVDLSENGVAHQVPDVVGQSAQAFILVQRLAELVPLVRPQRMSPRTGGKLEHTSALFRLHISRILPRRLCITQHRYRTHGKQIENCP